MENLSTYKHYATAIITSVVKKPIVVIPAIGIIELSNIQVSTWTIAALECATEENGLNKVVKTVHWRYKGTDETSGISTIKSILGIV